MGINNKNAKKKKQKKKKAKRLVFCCSRFSFMKAADTFQLAPDSRFFLKHLVISWTSGKKGGKNEGETNLSLEGLSDKT